MSLLQEQHLKNQVLAEARTCDSLMESAVGPRRATTQAVERRPDTRRIQSQRRPSGDHTRAEGTHSRSPAAARHARWPPTDAAQRYPEAHDGNSMGGREAPAASRFAQPATLSHDASTTGPQPVPVPVGARRPAHDGRPPGQASRFRCHGILTGEIWTLSVPLRSRAGRTGNVNWRSALLREYLASRPTCSQRTVRIELENN